MMWESVYKVRLFIVIICVLEIIYSIVLIHNLFFMILFVIPAIFFLFLAIYHKKLLKNYMEKYLEY
jgi:hypothetical protein